MPEEVAGKQVFTLFEVTRSIQRTIAKRYTANYWIKAEMNKLNHYRHSGHCYPELVEKRNGKIIAQIRCNLWKDDYLRIDATFRKILNEPLKDGIKILFLASIGFHPEYGLSLNIMDIDPNFTLGDLEREKQETLQRLRDEGIMDQNKRLLMPVLPQRIAVISVETSKGYADFLKVLEGAQQNEGYAFFQMLFPSLLQGDRASASIIRQLRRIKKVFGHFDVVVIIRGGGGDIGLSCYNQYLLAREIAVFPIPVMTGIGHATNETVVEMISHENAITPTKLAERLIQKMHDFARPVKRAEEQIIDHAARFIREEKHRLKGEAKIFRSATRNILLSRHNDLRENVKMMRQHARYIYRQQQNYLQGFRVSLSRNTVAQCGAAELTLQQLSVSLQKDVSSKLEQEEAILENLEKNIHNMSPDNILRRGFSITRLNGKAVSSAKQLQAGDVLETVLPDGEVSSTVQSIKEQQRNE